jgi:hypothetical protein
MILRTLHRTSAVLLGLFAFLHLANHLASLSSIALHLDVMTKVREIYQVPIVEAVILTCVVIQVSSGLWLVLRGWSQRKGLIPLLQAISGGYLALFLLVHVGAVVVGRTVLNLDTNFYFAAAGFHVTPFQYFFGPYYFLAVLALFTHLGCAAYWWVQSSSLAIRRMVVVLPMLFGGLISLLIVLSLGGLVHPFDVPEKYKATYGRKI